MWLPREYIPSELSPQEKARQMGKEGYTSNTSRGGCWPRSGLGDLSGDGAGKTCRDPESHPLVETDVGRRLFFQLRDKNEQCEGAGLAWVCLGDYGGLWQSRPLQGKLLSGKLDILTPYLQAKERQAIIPLNY